jgi:hypothetical protein
MNRSTPKKPTYRNNPRRQDGQIVVVEFKGTQYVVDDSHPPPATGSGGWETAPCVPETA